MEHQIFIAHRKRQAKSLLEEFGAVPVFDVTWALTPPLHFPKDSSQLLQ